MIARADVDDELVSAYMDGQLSPAEEKAVASLVQTDQSWAERLEAFQQDAKLLRKLPVPELTDQKRELILALSDSSLPAGAERRRVPRFRRRWMLLVAVVVPTVFTLLFFSNPNDISRLYLKKDGLELQAGRSILDEDIETSKTWLSPKLWGKYAPEDTSGLGFQVDAEGLEDRTVQGEVEYDFDGDGKVDRREVYEVAELDARKGWERFEPELEKVEGDFKEFIAGEVRVTLRVPPGGKKNFRVSGTPGELIVPYRGLRTSKGAYE